VLDESLAGLVERVTRRMRKADRVGRTVVLRLRFGDYSRITRSHTLAVATAHTATILGAVRQLLAEAMPLLREHGVTLVGVSVANLHDGRYLQLALPFDAASGVALDQALDAVRDRFGSTAVSRATLLGHDPELTVPLLPD
jgi:DNA polymerase-4